MSSPSTRTLPSSGFKRPRTSLMSVDFPPPEPPRMIRVSPPITLKLRPSSTLCSSNQRCTSRNSIAGTVLPCPLDESGQAWPNVEPSSCLRNFAKPATNATSFMRHVHVVASLNSGASEEDLNGLRQKEVRHDDEDGRVHDRTRRRAADPDSPARCLHALPARHRSDDEREDERLDEPGGNVLGLYPAQDGRDERLHRLAVERGGDRPTADDTRGVRDERQKGQHAEQRDEPRGDQFSQRVNAQSAQGVYLLGDDHRAEFRSDGRAYAPRNHQRRDDR